MASPNVYSTRFFRGYVSSQADATALAYVVPEGKVIVVRSISVFASTPGDVFVGLLAGTLVIPLHASGGLVQYRSSFWNGMAVLTAGEQLRTQWVSGVIAVNAHGYLFNA